MTNFLALIILQARTGSPVQCVRCKSASTDYNVVLFLNFPPQYFVRSTKLCLPNFFGALVKGMDPDRMKGALHVLWNKGIGMVHCPDD